MSPRRRALLRALVASGAAGLAGCPTVAERLRSGGGDGTATSCPGSADGLEATVVESDLAAASGASPSGETPGIDPERVTKFAPTNGREGERFGVDVAVSGTLALVGTGDGAAYVFERAGGSWQERARLAHPQTTVGDGFGSAVALGDGLAVVGAPGRDDESGRAYVFERVEEGWSETATLAAADRDTHDRFGSAVALAGETVLVGAVNDEEPNGETTDFPIRGAGSAYIFRRSGDGWAQRAKLAPGDGAGGDRFGSAVALADGCSVVGAHRGEDATPKDPGAAYVFDL